MNIKLPITSKMLSIRPANGNYCPCSINKYIQTWSSMAFLYLEHNWFSGQKWEDGEDSSRVMLPSPACTHTFLQSTDGSTVGNLSLELPQVGVVEI